MKKRKEIEKQINSDSLSLREAEDEIVDLHITNSVEEELEEEYPTRKPPDYTKHFCEGIVEDFDTNHQNDQLQKITFSISTPTDEVIKRCFKGEDLLEKFKLFCHSYGTKPSRFSDLMGSKVVLKKNSNTGRWELYYSEKGNEFKELLFKYQNSNIYCIGYNNKVQYKIPQEYFLLLVPGIILSLFVGYFYGIGYFLSSIPVTIALNILLGSADIEYKSEKIALKKL